MAESEWLRRSAHVEDLRPDPDAAVEVLVRHHCQHDHEHRSWVPAPAALAARVPPYTVAVLVNRDHCDQVRFDSDETVNAAGLFVAVAAVAAIVVIIALLVVIL